MQLSPCSNLHLGNVDHCSVYVESRINFQISLGLQQIIQRFHEDLYGTVVVQGEGGAINGYVKLI